MEKVTLKAYAKLNLGLNILGVLENGYHNIESIMASVDVADEITIYKSNTNEVYMDGVMQSNKNTAAKALNIFTQTFGGTYCVKIIKHIPICGGMGGSSADASGVFAGLIKLSGVQEEMVYPLLKQAGSDVTFMFKGGVAKVGKTGEQVNYFPFKNDQYFLVVKPKGSVDTTESYKLYDLMCSKLDKATIKNLSTDIKKVESCLKKGKPLCEVNNMLLISSAKINTEVHTIYTMMKNQTTTASMTGSGSCVFGLFNNLASAQKASVVFGGVAERVFLTQIKNIGVEFI